MEYAAALAVTLLAGAITGLTGFGFALVLVPPLLLFFDPATVVSVRLLLGLSGGWLPLLGIWRETRLDALARIIPASYLGMTGGLAILLLLPGPLLKLLASIVVVGFAGLLLRSRGKPFAISQSRSAAPAAGLLSGALSTSTGLGGPPVVMLLTARGYPIPAFRATILAYVLALDLAALPAFLLTGTLTADHLRLAALLTPAAYLGRFAGIALVRRVSPAGFRRLTLILLLATGLTGIAAAARGLLDP